MPFVRNPRDFTMGVIFLGVGLAAIIIGRDYPMGSATKMGAAFFPTVLGGVLAVIGAIAVVRALLHPGPSVGALAYRQAIIVIAATVLFGVIVRGGGLAIAVLVLVMLSAAASARFRWGPAAILAIGLAVFSVLVFVKALGLPIPAVGSWLGG